MRGSVALWPETARNQENYDFQHFRRDSILEANFGELGHERVARQRLETSTIVSGMAQSIF